MGDIWKYTGLKALGSGQKVKFLDHIFHELYEWTKSVTETYEDFPVGYTEWTLAAHLNIVVNRCDFMSYSEYGLKLRTPIRKLPRGMARPDLYIYNKDWRNSCLFELKKGPILLVSGANIPNKIVTMMKKAYPELQKIAKNNNESAQYGCSALAFTVWMNWLVNGKDRWQKKRWNDPQKYEGDWDNLWYEKFESAVRDAKKKAKILGRFYYCGYRMPHSVVERHYQTAVKEAKKEERDDDRLAIGMLWVLAIKPWKEITNS